MGCICSCRIYQVIKDFIFRWRRNGNLGVQALVIKDNKVLLVRHTYMNSHLWYTVGGGIKAGESPLQAIKRELAEEVGVITELAPKLFAIYINKRNDYYVILYICEQFIENNEIDRLEIAEKQWFGFNELPDNLSPATRHRIDEYLNKEQIGENW